MNKKPSRFFIILILMMSLPFTSACSRLSGREIPDWKLVYHHDENGERISGSKDKLLQLVHQGRPIRIQWPIRDVLFHYMDGNFITVMNGEVFAQTHGIIRQLPDRETRKRIALDASEQSHWHAILATTGELRSFQSVEGELKDYRFPLKWFVYY